jgi:hypothetical protein
VVGQKSICVNLHLCTHGHPASEDTYIFYQYATMKNTSSVQAVIRYTFTETVVGGRRTTALIKAGIPKASEDLALVYLMQKYPERHNIEISEVTFYDH